MCVCCFIQVQYIQYIHNYYVKMFLLQVNFLIKMERILAYILNFFQCLITLL